MTIGYFKSYDNGRIYPNNSTCSGEDGDVFYPSVGYSTDGSRWIFSVQKNGGKTKKHLPSFQGLRELFLFDSLRILDKTKVWIQ